MNNSLCATTIRHVKEFFIALLHKDDVTNRVRNIIDIEFGRRLQRNKTKICKHLVPLFTTSSRGAMIE